MEKKSLLEGKKILIVDDEPDVLDTLVDLLDTCDVVKASLQNPVLQRFTPKGVGGAPGHSRGRRL